MNYRSAVIYGRFAAVDDENDKKTAMAAFLDHISPGRNAAVRPASPAWAGVIPLGMRPVSRSPKPAARTSRDQTCRWLFLPIDLTAVEVQNWSQTN